MVCFLFLFLFLFVCLFFRYVGCLFCLFVCLVRLLYQGILSIYANKLAGKDKSAQSTWRGL